MPGWLTLVVDLGPDKDRRAELMRRLRAHGVVNETALLVQEQEVGFLAALSKDALKAAKEATADLVGQARALRVDADLIATDQRLSKTAFVFLAVDLRGNSIDHDDPAVSGAIRSYLGQYLPILGLHFIGVSTLLDRIMYAGGLTAVEADSEDEARQLTVDDPLATTVSRSGFSNRLQILRATAATGWARDAALGRRIALAVSLGATIKAMRSAPRQGPLRAQGVGGLPHLQLQETCGENPATPR